MNHTSLKKYHAAVKVAILTLSLALLPGFFCSPQKKFDYPRQEALVIEDGIRKFGKGRAEYREGIPFLELEGTHYEMGYQYGILMKDELAEGIKGLKATINAFFDSLPAVYRPLARFMFNRRLARKEASIPQKYRDELDGLSRASGIDYDELTACIFFPDLVSSMGCTSILVKSRGGILHGRNLDFVPPLLGRYPLIIEYRPRDGHRYAHLSVTGCLPGLTGMNDAGISISLNMSSLAEEKKEQEMPVGYKLREILERAGSLAEVKSLMKGYSCDQGWIFTVASGKERSGIIYDIAGKDIRSAAMEGDLLFAENLFVNDELNKTHRTAAASHGDYNLNRIARVEKIAKGAASPEKMLDVLKDTDFYHYKKVLGRFTVNNHLTVQTIVMDPVRGEIYFGSAPMYAGFSKIIKYARATGRVTIFRKEDPALQSPAVKQMLSWADRFFSDPRRLLKSADLLAGLKMNQADLLFVAAKFAPDLVDMKALLPVLDRFIAEYPDYIHPYRLKGDALVRLGRYLDAVPVLDRALQAKISSPDEIMQAHALLARAHVKLDHAKIAREHARKALRILAQYNAGRTEKKFRNELQKI